MFNTDKGLFPATQTCEMKVRKVGKKDIIAWAKVESVRLRILAALVLRRTVRTPKAKFLRLVYNVTFVLLFGMSVHL